VWMWWPPVHWIHQAKPRSATKARQYIQKNG